MIINNMKDIMKRWVVNLFVLSFLFTISCNSASAQYEKIDLSNNSYDTSVFRKVLPPDAIRAVLKPEFKTLVEALKDTVLNYIKDDDWIFVVKYNNQTKLYPIMPMIWHEAVNDNIDDFQHVVTYCILMSSAIFFNRNPKNDLRKTFGVSGCLYNTNIVLYDYQTRST